MKFDDLKPEDLQYLATVHKNTEIPYDQRIDILKNKFGKSERTIRRWLKRGKFSKYEAIENEQVRQGKLKGFDPSKKIKFITWAQNATPIHAAMLKNMETYAEFLNAEIFVIAGRYNNPTSVYSEKMENDEWWDTSIIQYLGSSSQTIHSQLDVLAEVKIVPTAVNPLSELHGLSHGRSCILGHPRMHLESLPVLEGHNPKLMLTTGALTLKNYTDSKAGIKAAFNHVYGFAIVEIRNDDIHYVRQVPVSTDGTFTDLIYHVDEEVKEIDSCAAFIMGDIHVDDVEEDIVKETLRYFGKVRPEKVVLHDIVNGTSVNHYDSKDPIALYQKYKEGTNIIKREVDGAINFIKKFNLTDYDLYSVASNHNDWFDRYLRETDWRKDIANSETYMEYALASLRGRATKGIIAHILEKEFEGKIKCLDRDESLQVRGFELSQHGDVGANGARGSIEGYRKLNTKIVTGHQHCLPLEYQVQFRDRGWGEIKTAKVGDEILSYNPLTATNEWQTIDNYYEFDYKGVMLKIEGNGFEQTFTSNHYLMLKDGAYIPATEAVCTRSARDLPLSANPVLGGISVPDITIRRIVAIAADGSIERSRIKFHLKKQRKIDRLYSLFGESVVKYASKDGSFYGYIPFDAMPDVIKHKPHLGRTKRLSTEVLSWDSPSLEVLQEELSYWDGTYAKENNGRQWSSASKTEVNIVMSVLSRLGYSCALHKKRSVEQDCSIVSWCVDRDFNRTTSQAHHEARFGSWGFHSYTTNKARVACLSVENKCFWVKSDKKGQVSLTGNSVARKDGVVTVGTYTKLRLPYNKGASAWRWAGVATHHNGKSQQLIFQKDKKCSTLF